MNYYMLPTQHSKLLCLYFMGVKQITYLDDNDIRITEEDERQMKFITNNMNNNRIVLPELFKQKIVKYIQFLEYYKNNDFIKINDGVTNNLKKFILMFDIDNHLENKTNYLHNEFKNMNKYMINLLTEHNLREIADFRIFNITNNLSYYIYPNIVSNNFKNIQFLFCHVFFSSESKGAHAIAMILNIEKATIEIYDSNNAYDIFYFDGIFNNNKLNWYFIVFLNKTFGITKNITFINPYKICESIYNIDMCKYNYASPQSLLNDTNISGSCSFHTLYYLEYRIRYFNENCGKMLNSLHTYILSKIKNRFFLYKREIFFWMKKYIRYINEQGITPFFLLNGHIFEKNNNITNQTQYQNDKFSREFKAELFDEKYTEYDGLRFLDHTTIKNELIKSLNIHVLDIDMNIDNVLYNVIYFSSFENNVNENIFQMIKLIYANNRYSTIEEIYNRYLEYIKRYKTFIKV